MPIICLQQRQTSLLNFFLKASTIDAVSLITICIISNYHIHVEICLPNAFGIKQNVIKESLKNEKMSFGL